MESEMSKLKFKQLVCENSHELREFERKLMTAYNTQVLNAKIAAERTEKKRQQALEKQIAEAERQRFQCEAERLIQEDRKKREEELELARVLSKQMEEKQKLAYVEKLNMLKECAEVEKQVEEEKRKLKNLAERKVHAKVELRKEQMEFNKWQTEIKERRRQHEKAEEKRFIEEATCLFGKDLEEMERRRARMEEFEAVKRILAQQLVELAELERRKEEIRERLMCIEREELEQKKEEEEELKKIRSRQLAKQIYSESNIEKKVSLLQLKEDDINYANCIRKQIEADEKREDEIRQFKHQQRQILRSENEYLIGLKTARKTEELIVERKEAEAQETARIERERIVAEERIRLLSSLDPELLKLLPRGSLSEEDTLCLNACRTSKKVTDFPTLSDSRAAGINDQLTTE